jgi:L-ribulose-5-phosphate 3-epimerase UlaE
MIEQNTFRRVDENTVVLDGLIWTSNTDKSIRVKNNDSGMFVHSIKLEDKHYYPFGIDRNNKKKSYSVIVENK